MKKLAGIIGVIVMISMLAMNVYAVETQSTAAETESAAEIESAAETETESTAEIESAAETETETTAEIESAAETETETAAETDTEEVTGESDEEEQPPVVYNYTEFSDVQNIDTSYAVFGKTVSWEYPYTDEMFSLPTDEYNHTLAKASLGLAASAFRDTVNEETQDDNLIDFLTKTGFEDIDTETYKTEPTTESIAYGLAHKQIDDFTLVVLAVCGGNYSKEWASNMLIGDEDRAVGFNNAAQQVEEGLYEYMEEQGITGKVKLWITGYSRSGAVSNIAAADITDTGIFDSVYAYLFAVPRTTRTPGNYTNIFNIIGKDDVVPKVPLADWGYKRYGRDLYTLSVETDTDCTEMLVATNEVYEEMTGVEMTVNTAANYQLRTILDYLLLMMPDAKTYTETLQPVLIEMMSGGDIVDAISVLMQALSTFSSTDTDSQYETQELMDYLQTLANTYMLQDVQSKMNADTWDPELGMTNLFSEHFPYKYAARLFASDDPNEIYSENRDYIRFLIYGNATIQIENEDGLYANILEDGTVQNYYPNSSYTVPDVVCSNDQTNITLPLDKDWTVYITTTESQMLGYTAFGYSGETVRADMDDIYYITTVPNRMYYVEITTDSEKPIDADLSEYDEGYETDDLEYSPSLVKMMENTSIRHITLTDIITVAIALAIVLVLEIIITAALAIVRKNKKRKRYFILTAILHFINAVIFYDIEMQLWYFVPKYPIARIVCKLLVFLVIMIFALKGHKKRRNRFDKILFIIMLAIMAADTAVEMLTMRNSIGMNWIVPAAVYVILFIGACLTWRIPGKLSSRLIRYKKAVSAAKNSAKENLKENK